MIFTTIGEVKGYNDYLVAYVDRAIGYYFYSLIPKSKHVIKQKYPPHVTIVRKDREHVADWRHLEGKKVEIQIDTEVKSNNKYYWLDAYSQDINDVRVSLGYEPFREPFNTFHITIGNTKVVHLLY